MIEIERLENSQYKYYAEIDGKIYTKNKRTSEITEKSSRINKDGYLDIKANSKTRILHRLIAEVFIPCDSDIKGLVVNHKDGNKLNNLPSNLEWCTNKYNTQHYYKELASLEEVVIINKISKEVIAVFKIRSDAFRKYGIWVNESVRGNSTYGNLIAVKKSEFEESTIDEMVKKRVNKSSVHLRRQVRKYTQAFVDTLQHEFNMWQGSFTDFCKHKSICSKIVNKMIKGTYFTEPSRKSRVKCSSSYYSGITKITEKYNSKFYPLVFKNDV